MPVPAVSDSQILLHGHRGRPKADKKQKVREIRDFTNFLARREGFEPPAFWSVGYLGAKMASFRLRFAVLSLFTRKIFRCFRPELPAPFVFWVKSGSEASA